MKRDVMATIIDGVFSKALQVRRMLARGAVGSIPVPLAEIVALGRRLETMAGPEEIEQAVALLGAQRWERTTVEVGTREGYAGWVAQYDDEANALIALEEPVTLAMIGEAAGKDILDAGCGTGRYALRLAEAGGRVSAVDPSPEMLAAARRKAAERGLAARFLPGELSALPFPDACFDLAVCALVLCHVADIKGAVGELARVVRPGGQVVISDFHPFCLLVGWRTGFRAGETICFIENHQHLIEEYVEAVLASGLEVTELREAVVDESVIPVLSAEDVERFRGWPVALVISATKKEEKQCQG